MTSAVNEAIFTFLLEEELGDTLFSFERESGAYFDQQAFNTHVKNGNFDGALAYLSGFTFVNDNAQSREIFRKIRLQKLIEQHQPDKDNNVLRMLLVKQLDDLVAENPRLHDNAAPTFKTKGLRHIIKRVWTKKQKEPLMPPPPPRLPKGQQQHEAGEVLQPGADRKGKTILTSESSQALPPSNKELFLGGAGSKLAADPTQGLRIILRRPSQTAAQPPDTGRQGLRILLEPSDIAAQPSQLSSSQPEGSSSSTSSESSPSKKRKTHDEK